MFLVRQDPNSNWLVEFLSAENEIIIDILKALTTKNTELNLLGKTVNSFIQAYIGANI